MEEIFVQQSGEGLLSMLCKSEVMEEKTIFDYTKIFLKGTAKTSISKVKEYIKNRVGLCNSYHKRLSSLAYKNLLKIMQNQQINIFQQMCKGYKQTVHRRGSTNSLKICLFLITKSLKENYTCMSLLYSHTTLIYLTSDTTCVCFPHIKQLLNPS